jgi:hypothetical protein
MISAAKMPFEDNTLAVLTQCADPTVGDNQPAVFCTSRRLLAIVRDDEVCQRLMTTPGVGPVVALTYRATVDVPARFRKSKSVGAVFGLTCSKYQSGEIDRSGRISRCGAEHGGTNHDKPSIERKKPQRQPGLVW